MDFLKDHEAIREMLRLMEENNRQDQAKEFARLIACVDSMEQQYAAVLSELRDVKQQLSEMPEQRRSMKDTLTDMAQALEDRVEEMREQLQTIREKIISCAKDAVSGFQQMGVSALDKAVYALGIKKLLESVQDKICGSMEKTSASIQRVEAMGQELRSAGNHLKNAGRAAVGKEIQQTDTAREGRFQAAVLAPMRAANAMYAGMNRTIYGALGAVDRLERAAERTRGKRERPSVRQRLEEKKTETQARPLALPDPSRKPHEAAR